MLYGKITKSDIDHYFDPKITLLDTKIKECIERLEILKERKLAIENLKKSELEKYITE